MQIPNAMRRTASRLVFYRESIWEKTNVSRRCDLRDAFGARGHLLASVKEVIQPQVPLRLPCYDFAPVIRLAFGGLVPCGF
jgi:hypothetical protein